MARGPCTWRLGDRGRACYTFARLVCTQSTLSENRFGNGIKGEQGLTNAAYR